MISLSLIEAEAQGLVGRLPESRRLAQQGELVDLCEKHWLSLRGSQPNTPLARMLWSVTPPLADLLIDLYAESDTQLVDVFPGGSLARGMALLVLAEIERGNEAGVYIAYDPMMAFKIAPPSISLLECIKAMLRGKYEPPPMHQHDKHPSMWKALAVIAAHIKRPDLPAVLGVIAFLAGAPDHVDAFHDVALEKLHGDVGEVGIHFLNIDKDQVYFQLHGHAHKPVRTRRLGEMLLEIKQMWLG